MSISNLETLQAFFESDTERCRRRADECAAEVDRQFAEERKKQRQVNAADELWGRIDRARRTKGGYLISAPTSGPVTYTP
jgi:hypothetical protein